jgi:hypothetical protein
VKHAGTVLMVLVLVGVPLGVFAVALHTPPAHRVSSLAAVERRFRAELRRKGATDIRCGRMSSGHGVFCSGALSRSSSSTLYELGAGP